MRVAQRSQSSLTWIPAFKMEPVLSVSSFTVISAFWGLFTPLSVYSENSVLSSSVINPWVCACSWISFLSSMNKNSDSHFISNMDKTQTIILSEKLFYFLSYITGLWDGVGRSNVQVPVRFVVPLSAYFSSRFWQVPSAQSSLFYSTTRLGPCGQSV